MSNDPRRPSRSRPAGLSRDGARGSGRLAAGPYDRRQARRIPRPRSGAARDRARPGTGSPSSWRALAGPVRWPLRLQAVSPCRIANTSPVAWGDPPRDGPCISACGRAVAVSSVMVKAAGGAADTQVAWPQCHMACLELLWNDGRDDRGHRQHSRVVEYAASAGEDARSSDVAGRSRKSWSADRAASTAAGPAAELGDAVESLREGVEAVEHGLAAKLGLAARGHGVAGRPNEPGELADVDARPPLGAFAIAMRPVARSVP